MFYIVLKMELLNYQVFQLQEHQKQEKLLILQHLMRVLFLFGLVITLAVTLLYHKQILALHLMQFHQVMQMQRDLEILNMLHHQDILHYVVKT